MCVKVPAVLAAAGPIRDEFIVIQLDCHSTLGSQAQRGPANFSGQLDTLATSVEVPRMSRSLVNPEIGPCRQWARRASRDKRVVVGTTKIVAILDLYAADTIAIRINISAVVIGIGTMDSNGVRMKLGLYAPME